MSARNKVNVVFAEHLRKTRHKAKLTQQESADEMGVGIYSYQRLENPLLANPTLKTLVKLKRVFPKLNFEKVAKEVLAGR